MSFVFQIHTDYGAEGILSNGIKMPVEAQPPINFDATVKLVVTAV